MYSAVINSKERKERVDATNVREACFDDEDCIAMCKVCTRRSTSSKIVQSSRFDGKPTFIRCSRMFSLWSAIPLFRYDCFCYSRARESARGRVQVVVTTRTRAHAHTYTCAHVHTSEGEQADERASSVLRIDRSSAPRPSSDHPSMRTHMCAYVYVYV